MTVLAKAAMERPMGDVYVAPQVHDSTNKAEINTKIKYKVLINS